MDDIIITDDSYSILFPQRISPFFEADFIILSPSSEGSTLRLHGLFDVTISGTVNDPNGKP